MASRSASPTLCQARGTRWQHVLWCLVLEYMGRGGDTSGYSSSRGNWDLQTFRVIRQAGNHLIQDLSGISWDPLSQIPVLGPVTKGPTSVGCRGAWASAFFICLPTCLWGVLRFSECWISHLLVWLCTVAFLLLNGHNPNKETEKKKVIPPNHSIHLQTDIEIFPDLTTILRMDMTINNELRD